MDEYRGDAAWAYIEAVSRNLFYNQIRSQNVQKRAAPQLSLDDGDHQFSISDGRDVAEELIDRQEALHLRAAVEQLPPGMRTVLSLWLDDFKYDEIARTTGLTLDAVKSRLRDAKKILRSALSDRELHLDEDHDEKKRK